MNATLPGALAGGLVMAGIIYMVTGWVSTPPASGSRPPARWRTTLARLRVTPRMLVLAIAAGLAVLLITGWPIAGLATVPAVIAIPRIVSTRQVKARITRLEALEQWTLRLGDVLAASRSLEEALTLSVRTAPTAIKPAVTTLATHMRTQHDTGDALRRFAAQLDDPVGDLVASALLIAAERRGPGVHAVLTELADDVAKDVAARRDIEAERASYRTALRWLIAFLAGYTIFLVLNRTYAAPFSTPVGQVVLTLVAVCYGAGLCWLHRLGLMRGPARFLGPEDQP